MKNKWPVAESITSDNLMAELLLSLKPSSSSSSDDDTLPATTATASLNGPIVSLARNHRPSPPSVKDNTSGTLAPESSRPSDLYSGDKPLKLDELNPAMAEGNYSPQLLDDAGLCRNILDHLSTLGEVLAHRAMSDEISPLVKLSCLTPQLVSRFERSLKVAQRKSKRYKRKVADKDEEIRRLNEEVKHLKIGKKKLITSSKVKEVIRCLDEVSGEHKKEMSVLKTCLHAQLEDKDRLLVEGATELDSLVAELNSHLAKEQVWVEESQTLKSRVEELSVDNRRLEDDRKWLISEGFAHVINKVHLSREFSKPYADFVAYVMFRGFQHGLKNGYRYSAEGVPIEELDFYRPGIGDKLMLVFRWLYDLRLPYVNELSSMVDQPLDVIRGLEPDKKLASKGSDMQATNKITWVDVAHRVDKYLKQLEPGHVDDVGVPP